MKFYKLTFFFCVALLPSIIHGKELLEYARDVEKLASKNVLINGIFKPHEGGFRGNGSFGFVHIGFMLPNDKDIAMKFTLPSEESTAIEEYNMYCYLHAINSTEAEKYGIPSVYYYGKWQETGLILMGFSVLDKNIEDLVKSGKLLEHDVNVLIVLRDFILSSKYMHKYGIRHDDIYLRNLMTRGYRTYIIDFNISNKMDKRSWNGTPEYASRRFHSDGIRTAVDDWECFLYSMCAVLPGVKFDWLKLKSNKMLKYKEDTDKTIRRIEKIKSTKLRQVFVRFAQHIFIDCANEKYPEYDVYYNWIDDEINYFGLPQPVMFTWLKNEERDNAIAEFNRNPTPNITNLLMAEDEINYAEPDPEFFTRAYAHWHDLQG